MRSSTNPVFKNLTPNAQQGGYGNFASGAAGAAQFGNQFGQNYTDQYTQPGYQPQQAERPITIDDVVTKTGITLGVLSISAVIAYVLSYSNPGLAAIFSIGGGLVGLGIVLVSVFRKSMPGPGIVLTYAAAEGLFLGAISLMFTNVAFGGVGGSGLIIQAVLGTVGVFAGMLVVYKTGAIRVTPRFTRMLMGALIGVLVLMVGNLIASFFMDGGFGLRDGGPLAIIFSLVCIGLAAFSFLLDFDQADQLIRAQAPEKAAWSVAFGLTVTLVWLYVEILRLLSYFNSND